MTDLARALNAFVIAEGATYITVTGPSLDEVRLIFDAARERLKLTRQPCDECKGSGEIMEDSASVVGIPGGFIAQRCPRCGGSGLGDWPADLVEVVAQADGVDPHLAELFRNEARAVLDALDLYAKEATK